MRALRLDRGADEDAPPAMPLATADASSEARLLHREAGARLRAVVKGLPRAHRDALLLMATRDLRYEDAAALLGVPVGTVKWRVSHARRMLRERLPRM